MTLRMTPWEPFIGNRRREFVDMPPAISAGPET